LASAVEPPHATVLAKSGIKQKTSGNMNMVTFLAPPRSSGRLSKSPIPHSPNAPGQALPEPGFAGSTA
jgi:hypothetical protein